jgi:hypothetical protein
MIRVISALVVFALIILIVYISMNSKPIVSNEEVSVDCKGSWSACNKKCERTFAVETQAEGKGEKCPTIPPNDCLPGTGKCPVENVDCKGSWSVCNEKCLSNFIIETPAKGKGRKCPSTLVTGCLPGTGKCPVENVDCKGSWSECKQVNICGVEKFGFSSGFGNLGIFGNFDGIGGDFSKGFGDFGSGFGDIGKGFGNMGKIDSGVYINPSSPLILPVNSCFKNKRTYDIQIPQSGNGKQCVKGEEPICN